MTCQDQSIRNILLNLMEKLTNNRNSSVQVCLTLLNNEMNHKKHAHSVTEGMCLEGLSLVNRSESKVNELFTQCILVYQQNVVIITTADNSAQYF